MFVLSPNAMTVILIEAQAPFRSIYCCPSDRNVSHQLRSIRSCIKHTHKKEGPSEKEFTYDIIHFDTKIALENPAYSPDLRPSKYHSIHPFPAPKLKQNYGGHKFKDY
jgi:hypothetical protein